VLAPAGRLVLADVLTMRLLPTSVALRRDHARSRAQVTSLLGAAGFLSVRWRRLYPFFVSAAVAVH
jgi:hypothetical protein